MDCNNVTLQNYDPLDLIMKSLSSWYSLKVRVACFLKVKSFLSKGAKDFSINISISDLKIAENAIVKYSQEKHFGQIINSLKAGSPLLKGNPLRKLNPFLDTDGILRVGGRINNSNLAFDVVHPLILPDSFTTELYVKHIHRSLGHLGRNTILSEIRKKYYILKGSSLVRRVTNNCLACRKIHAKPSQVLMAELPSSRLVGDSPAFTNVALDCFGPFMVHQGRKIEKRYGIVFSCLASRAIHLEIVHSMSSSSFICALRRFIARRGNVESVLCDNGSNFVGGKRELREAINEFNKFHVENFLKQNMISFKFNVPYASHHGGVYEREIRSVRKVLNALLLEQPLRMNDEDLTTFMCEAEAVLNNRPLTEISSDPLDFTALTPNNLLLLNAGVTFPPGLFDKNDIYSRRRWRQTQYLVDLFWSRWRKEYIVLLQQRQKWTSNERSHQIGDLVLVADNLLPRNQWCLGRVVAVNHDKYNVVRSASVRISRCKNGNLKDFSTVIIERPIVKLILLSSLE
mgnify:CR=1 FL=1